MRGDGDVVEERVRQLLVVSQVQHAAGERLAPDDILDCPEDSALGSGGEECGAESFPWLLEDSER